MLGLGATGVAGQPAALAQRISSVLSDGGRFIIAHSQSAEKINELYSKDAFKTIAVKIKNALDEAKNFQQYFKIEKIIDNENKYIIVGTKRI